MQLDLSTTVHSLAGREDDGLVRAGLIGKSAGPSRRQKFPFVHPHAAKAVLTSRNNVASVIASLGTLIRCRHVFRSSHEKDSDCPWSACRHRFVGLRDCSGLWPQCLLRSGTVLRSASLLRAASSCCARTGFCSALSSSRMGSIRTTVPSFLEHRPWRSPACQ